MTFASAAFAKDSCTYVMKDRYGNEYETFTDTARGRDAACSDANYSCLRTLSENQRRGQGDLYCEEKSSGITIGGISIGGIGGISIGGIGGGGGITIGGIGPNRPPVPPSSSAICTTDLVDYYNSYIRSFTGYGQNYRQACAQSEQFCNDELYRNNSNGRRCVTRGSNGGGGYPYPNPRDVTENCRATRYDPSGYFIQSYNQTASGPIYSDVKGEACRRAYNQCTYELRGRQTCRIEG